MLFPDCDMRAWEICDSSVILANSDWYYTKQQTEELIDSVSGMNPTEVQDMINRSIHSKADKTYVDEKDTELSDSIRAINSNLTRVYTKTDVNNLLDMKVDKSTYSAYTATTNEAIDNKQDQLISGTNIRTINGESILGSGDLVIQGGGDITSGEVQTMIDEAVSGKQDTLIAGDNITIVNNVISSTAYGDVTSAQVETMIAEATNDMATQTWVQNQGYLTEHQSLSAYSTTQEMNEAISASTSGKADTTAVTQDIATATDDMATQTWVQNQGYLTEHQSLSAYSTTDEMNQAISAATDDMATETWVGNQGYITGVDLSNYATLQDIPTSNSALTNDAGYITSAALNGYATEQWVQNQGYLTEHQSLSAYSTTAEMNNAIDAAVSGKADTSTVEALGGVLTAHTANTTIHITQAERTAWNAKSDFSGDYNDLTNKPTNVSSFNNDVGYLTEHQSLSAYSTTVEVNNAIDAAVSGKADSTAVTQDIAAATADMATQTWVNQQGFLTEHQSLSAYSTTQEMNEAINASTSGKVDTTAFTSYSAETTARFAEDEEVTASAFNALNADLSGKADTTAVTQAISSATSDMATKTWVGEQGYLTEHQSLSAYSTTAEMNNAIDAAVSGKQDTLISGTNIKTINNVSILGSGNVDIQGGGNPTVEVTQAEYDALVSAGTVSADTFYIITDATAGDLSNYYTKSETDDLLDTKLDVSAYTPTDLTNYYTKSETSGATQISTALASKQDTLVSGTNIKTINNESILGSGNIEIQGGGGKAVSGGTNISITTGETADTINCTLPITATSSVFDTISVGKGSGGGSYNTLIGPNAKCNYSSRYNVFLVAQRSSNSSSGSYVNGSENVIIGSMKDGYTSWNIPSFSTSQSVVIGGGGLSTDKNNSLAIGYQANVSGTTKTNINNQLTIDTSNQVYIYNKDNTEMICLQDQLGGGAASSAITSGDTNAVAGGAVYSKFDEVEQVTAAALNALNDNFGGLKLVKLTQTQYDALATKDANTLYIIV